MTIYSQGLRSLSILLLLLAAAFLPSTSNAQGIDPSQIQNFPLYKSNPTGTAQDTLITNNYDNLFTYVGLSKSITTVSNAIGLANITQVSTTPGAHNAYAFYNVGDFTALGNKTGIGLENDVYYTDTGTNATILPALLTDPTTFGSANYTNPVTGIQSLVVHLGSGVMTTGAAFLAGGNANLGAGSITNSSGFVALDQAHVGATTTAGFYAAPQTSCSGCYGYFSASTNKDSFGNLTATTVSSPRFKSTGTVLIPGDFVLTGWGSGASVAVNNNASDAAGDTTITAGSGPSANPTVQLTFHDGTWGNTPMCQPVRADLTSPLPASAPWVRTNVSATTVTYTFTGTPVNGNAYGLTWICIGH